MACFTIGEQDQIMAVGKALCGILQQTPGEHLIAPPLYVRKHELTFRVNDLRFPPRLAFVLGISMPLVSFQHRHSQTLDMLIMKNLAVFADFSLQAAHHARMDFREPPCRTQTTPLRQMFGYRYCFLLTHFRIPQRGLLPFAELRATAAAAQIPDPVFPIRFAHRQIALTLLSVQRAAFIHAR
jgi:hypothetical protein